MVAGFFETPVTIRKTAQCDDMKNLDLSLKVPFYSAQYTGTGFAGLMNDMIQQQ
jgi:hypothetical protein